MFFEMVMMVLHIFLKIILLFQEKNILLFLLIVIIQIIQLILLITIKLTNKLFSKEHAKIFVRLKNST